MRTFSLLVSLLLTSALFAQEIHSPAELMKIMENSPITYELKELEEPVACPDRTENVNLNDVYRVEEGQQLQVYYYDTLTATGRENFEIAEAYFNKRQLDSARIFYQKVLETDPHFYKVATYIGQMYGSTGQLELAKQTYLETIDKNYIDYLAHWLLADIYMMQNKPDSAVHHVTIARILNRNNPRLRDFQMEVYGAAELDTTEWCFNPQVEISQPDSGKVSVAFSEKWLMYGLCKAVWTFEPGYKKSMGVAAGDYTTLEERECLANLMMGLLNSKARIKKNRQLKTLKVAIEEGMIDPFIMYEVFLPKHPKVAYQLTREFIGDIANYVIMLRHK